MGLVEKSLVGINIPNFLKCLGFWNEVEFDFKLCLISPLQVCPEVIPGLNSSGIFHGICAPGAAGNLWKRSFLMEKNFLGQAGI